MAGMGRRRETNLDLPPRMQMKHGAYYYVTSTTPRKWIRLHTDLPKSRVLWAEMENYGVDTSPLITELIDRWLASKAFDELALGTRKMYEGVSKQLRAFFSGARTNDVTPAVIASWLDNHHSKAMANQGKAVLTNVFNVAVRQGICDRNPCKEIKDLATPKRDRYITDAEYIAIRNNADPVLMVAMDLSYLTSLRVSDVVKISLSDITPEGLTVTQKKTKKKQLFTITPALRAVIDSAKSLPRPIRGMALLCSRTGQPYLADSFRNMWGRACKSAKVGNAHFHDIRAKAATDAKKLGMDYQKLLGHTNAAMSERYIRLREVDQVTPLPRQVG